MRAMSFKFSILGIVDEMDREKVESIDSQGHRALIVVPLKDPSDRYEVLSFGTQD